MPRGLTVCSLKRKTIYNAISYYTKFCLLVIPYFLVSRLGKFFSSRIKKIKWSNVFLQGTSWWWGFVKILFLLLPLSSWMPHFCHTELPSLPWNAPALPRGQTQLGSFSSAPLSLNSVTTLTSMGAHMLGHSLACHLTLNLGCHQMAEVLSRNFLTPRATAT